MATDDKAATEPKEKCILTLVHQDKTRLRINVGMMLTGDPNASEVITFDKGVPVIVSQEVFDELKDWEAREYHSGHMLRLFRPGEPEGQDAKELAVAEQLVYIRRHQAEADERQAEADERQKETNQKLDEMLAAVNRLAEGSDRAVKATVRKKPGRPKKAGAVAETSTLEDPLTKELGADATGVST